MFEDLNNDGVQDAGEAGIAGVEITLTGTDDLGNPVSLTTTTDADGNYTFDYLLSGDYTVTETQPVGYLDGIDTAGDAGGDTTTSDTTTGVALDPGQDATGYTFGELPASSISGSVVDDFGNPIPDTTITLTGTDDLGNPVSLTVTTAADGTYSFDDLRPGTYTVTETQPVGYGDGGETAGTSGGDTSTDDVIAGIQKAQQAGRNRRHSARRCDRAIGAFKRTHSVFEHANGRVFVSTVGIAGQVTPKPSFGFLRVVVHIARCQIESFRRFFVRRPVEAASHQFCFESPIVWIFEI